MLTSLTQSPSYGELSAAGEKEFPSFSAGNGYPYWISAAEDCLQRMSTVEDKEWSDDFEFAFSVTDSHRDLNATSKRFHPVHPLFNHEFVAGDSTETESAEAIRITLRELLIKDSIPIKISFPEDVGCIPPANFCFSEPQSLPQSPNRWKSHSTGTAGRRWRLRDLVFGRSRSDSKEKLGYVVRQEKKAVKCSPRRQAAKGELDMVTAHRLLYSKNGGGQQRSFLPYKRDLVGFFTGGLLHSPW